MRGFRLGSVLRARRAQEDSARGALVRSRSDAAAAAERVQLYHEAIDARPGPDSANGPAYAAALWARTAMAGELSAAVALAGEAEGVVAERMADLTAAATSRRTVEKLGERHAAAQREADEAAAQREADDLTNTMTVRKQAREGC